MPGLLPSLFYVTCGGAAGSALRYLVGGLMFRTLGSGFPYGTLAVNLLGGLLMGILIGLLARFGPPGHTWHLLLATGFLGGFTTFSAFSLDVVMMLQRSAFITAGSYIALSVIGSVFAVILGMWLVRLSTGSL